MKRSALLWFSSSALLMACSGGSSLKPDSGSPDGGSQVTCTAATKPTVMVADFYSGFLLAHSSLSVVDQDVYWIDSKQGMKLGPYQTGVIEHLRTDGTGLSTLVTPTGEIFSATAVGADLFYFQNDGAPGAAEVHLYRSPRATGGVGTQVGTDAYPQLADNRLNLCDGCGVFAQRGTDVFINTRTELSRVSTTTGTRTVIATATARFANPQVLYPSLDGATVFYKESDGAIFSASADATTASGIQIGTATCGNSSQWMARYANGFLCGKLSGIARIDAVGATTSDAIDPFLTGEPAPFNPSAVDGMSFYALPADSAKSKSIFKVDLTAGKTTAFLCDVYTVLDARVTSTELIYVDGRLGDGGSAAFSLRRVAR